MVLNRIISHQYAPPEVAVMLSAPTSKGIQETSKGIQENSAVRVRNQPNSDTSVRTVDQMEQQLDYVVDLIASDRATGNASVDQIFATPPTSSVHNAALRFSVILTCRSQGLELRSLLASAKECLSRLEGEHELILVDAVWHNSSVEACRELGISLAVAPRNRLGSMRAIGARNATGDVLTFVDVENAAALKCLPDHLNQLTKGCDAVQSDQSYCPVVLSKPVEKENRTSMAARDMLRCCFSQLTSALIRLACGVNTRVCECPVQSVRRPVWEQLRLTEQGAAASLELSLRCGWVSGNCVETCSDKAASCGTTPRMRESLRRFYDALRIALVQRPDRMVVAPAVATFVCALGLLAWTVMSARMLGSIGTMVWMGAASVGMMVAALWITAGWIATEYARQRKWMAPASKKQSYLGTISTQSSFSIGASMIVTGMLMMCLGAWLGASETTGIALSSPWVMSNVITWVWPGATLTLIGHQFSMAGMLVSWFRRQPLQ